MHKINDQVIEEVHLVWVQWKSVDDLRFDGFDLNQIICDHGECVYKTKKKWKSDAKQVWWQKNKCH